MVDGGWSMGNPTARLSYPINHQPLAIDHLISSLSAFIGPGPGPTPSAPPHLRFHNAFCRASVSPWRVVSLLYDVGCGAKPKVGDAGHSGAVGEFGPDDGAAVA